MCCGRAKRRNRAAAVLRLCNVGSFGQLAGVNRGLAPCPGRAKRDPGPRSDTTGRFNCPSILPCSPWVPALRSLTLARPGHESEGASHKSRVKSRRAKSEPLAVIPIHNVKQPSLPRSRGAFLRPGGVLVIASTPIEGRAERRQAHYVSCRVCETRLIPRSVRRGASHDAGRSPLGAPPWRFSAGGRASISGIASGSVQRAPRSQVVMPGGRCPGPPEPAVTSRSRRTPLPAPPSGSSLEDGPP